MSISVEGRLGSPVGYVSDPDPEVPERAKRRSYTARYKLEILAEYDGLDRDGKGGLLRREGLYSSLISEWRKQRDKGALEALTAKPGGGHSTRSSGTTSGCVNVSSGSKASWGQLVG